MKTKLAFFMSVIMIFSCLYTVNIHAENSIEIIESNGWFETAYVNGFLTAMQTATMFTAKKLMDLILSLMMS